MDEAREKKKANGEFSHSPEEYEERLAREIRLIKEMGFAGYFLIVWDLIKSARERAFPVGPGRGSAAGSLVAYSLGITDIDPIEYDLLFERFLNPERVSLPDIDIDFCGRRRQEMIDTSPRSTARRTSARSSPSGRWPPGPRSGTWAGSEVPLPEVDRIAKMIPASGQTPPWKRPSRSSRSSRSFATRTPKSPSCSPSPRSSRARSGTPPSTPPGLSSPRSR